MADILKRYKTYLLEYNLIFHSEIKGMYFYSSLITSLLEKLKKLSKKLFPKYEFIKIPSIGKIETIRKEFTHFQGFQKELFQFKNFFLTPTSESILYPHMSAEVKKLKKKEYFYFNICKAYRSESKDTVPLLREKEIFFFEAHSFHIYEKALESEIKYHLKRLNFFKKLFYSGAYLFQKSKKELFPGAESSRSLEILFKNEYLLQISTAHSYKTNFSKIYSISKDKTYYQISTFGFSSRLVGALILKNICDLNACVPFMYSPIQISVLFLDSLDQNDEKILLQKLKRYRVFKCSENKHYSQKLNFLKKSFAPLLFIFGKRELQEKKITCYLNTDNVFEKKTIYFYEINKKIKEYSQEVDRFFKKKKISEQEFEQICDICESEKIQNSLGYFISKDVKKCIICKNNLKSWCFFKKI